MFKFFLQLLLISILMEVGLAREAEKTVLIIDKKTEQIVKSVSDKNRNIGVLFLKNNNRMRAKLAYGFATFNTKRPIKDSDLFEMGSVTKMFTAIAIFQLIEDGKLSLDTPITKFYTTDNKIKNLANYNGKNYWNKITVGMLLNHTSGMIDYLNVFDEEKAYKMFNTGKKYTFNELIDLALTFKNMNFIPGTSFKYSNTGYLLLGDIITKVSKQDWRDFIKQHILDVAGVKNTYFATRIPKDIREKMPQGYYNFNPSYASLTLADSAGEMISTLDDLDTLINVWASGKFYAKKSTLQTQLTDGFHPMGYPIDISYGYGIMKIGNFYGHSGQTFGFETYVGIDIQSHTSYVINVNDATIRTLEIFNGIVNLNKK